MTALGMEFPFEMLKLPADWIEVVVAQHCECITCHFKTVSG